ncbi:unnamed protein product [Schistosoma margrebowiei]|uniref:Uncharacterized protein n=1 Tax=Schistosoma margrebowiei TaxID=48269 RepID=A0A183MV86_9TREM|nr:unnamed protein product [Schistosoma margrebowiei]
MSQLKLDHYGKPGSTGWPFRLIVGHLSSAVKYFQETLNPGFVLLGTSQQGVPVTLRELVPPGGLDPVSPSFTVRDVTTELSGPRLTSCRTEMLSQLIDQHPVINQL